MNDRKLSLNPLRPNGTPRKITISLDPALAEELDKYRKAYVEEYGHAADMEQIVPAILAFFLSRDRFFHRWKQQAKRETSKMPLESRGNATVDAPPSTDPSLQ